MSPKEVISHLDSVWSTKEVIALGTGIYLARRYPEYAAALLEGFIPDPNWYEVELAADKFVSALPIEVETAR